MGQQFITWHRHPRILTRSLVALLLVALPAGAREQILDIETSPRFPQAFEHVSVHADYRTSGGEHDTVSGLGWRLHWSSNQLDFVDLTEVYPTSLMSHGAVEIDLDDWDDDPSTDRFIAVAWADIDAGWPATGTTPVRLSTVSFTATNTLVGAPRLGVSVTSTAAGFTLSSQGLVLFRDGFESEDLTAWSSGSGIYRSAGVAPLFSLGEMPSGSASGSEGQRILHALMHRHEAPKVVVPTALDIDGDGEVDASTDAVLILRHLFGFTGEALVRDLSIAGSPRSTAAQVEAFLDGLVEVLDVDGDGTPDALTDGLLILRYLSGYRGEVLVEGAVGSEATRGSARDITSFLEILADPDGFGDADGDGLTDAQEVGGHKILVDFMGLGTHDPLWQLSLERRRVVSDPLRRDTDGDGLDDLAEFHFRTDPQRADTDGDGLRDIEELERYGSTPTSVDSDGDARGPDLALTPNPLLFDGNELALYLTSPALADTDGDAATDFVEANQNGTHPMIADVPRVAIELVGDVDLQLNLTSTQDTSLTDEETTSLTQGETNSMSNTDSTTNQWAVEATATVGVEADFGLVGGATVSSSLSVTGSYSEEVTATFTEESSRSSQQAFQSLQQRTTSFGETVSGGTIGMGLRIRNTGPIAFTLSNVVVTALLRDPEARDRFRTIATLFPDVPGNAVTLGPFNGETGVLRADSGDDDVNGNLIRSLMADPTGLYFDMASFDLLDEDGRNFAFLANVTNARTGLVTLDFGNGDVERYRVATLVERHADGSSAGVSMATIFDDILGIPFETTPRSGSTDPSFPDGVRLLTRVRDVEVDPENNAFWVVLSTEPRHAGNATDFEDIVLRSSESLSIAFVTDQDRDGLFAREEFLVGTVDAPQDFDGSGTIDAVEAARTLDFDQDQLTDFAEVREGWIVQVEGRAPRRVYPDPTSSNVDGRGRPDDPADVFDTLSDLEEYLGRDGVAPGAPGDSGDATDPTRPDTDGDGTVDHLDLDPLRFSNSEPDLSKLRFSIDPVSGLLVVDGEVLDAEDAIRTVVVDWGDGEQTHLSGGPSPLSVDASHPYLNPGRYWVEVTVIDDRQPPGVPASSSRTAGPFDIEAAGLAFYFFNGLGTDDRFLDSTPNHHHSRSISSNHRIFLTDGHLGGAGTAVCFVRPVHDGDDVCGEVVLPHLGIGANAARLGELTLSGWVLPGDRHTDSKGHLIGQRGYARLVLLDRKVRFELGPDCDSEPVGPNCHVVEDPVEVPFDDDPSDSEAQCAGLSDRADWRFYAAAVSTRGGDTTLTLFRGIKAGDAPASVSQVATTTVEDQVFTNPGATASRLGGLGQDCTNQTLSFGDPYIGRLDDVRFYDLALTGEQLDRVLNERQDP